MLLQQKQAWFHIILFSFIFLLAMILILFANVAYAQASLALFGLYGLTPLLFRKKKDPNEVSADERDREIAKQANLIGFALSYISFILSCMSIWAYFHFFEKTEIISVHILAIPVWIGFGVVIVARAIALLAFYGKEE